MKIKRPFALKTEKVSDDEIKKCAVDFKKTENTASEIAKMFVKYGKMAREFKQLTKEADKILSECNKNNQNAKYVKARAEVDTRIKALGDYAKIIENTMDNLKK